MSRDLAFDVLVIGAGPAGLAAAVAAAESGQRIGLVDDNPLAGGQIWRGGPDRNPPVAAATGHLLAQVNVSYLPSTKIVQALDANTLLAQTPDAAMRLSFKRLILATGARERMLPFPGWTLPGVTGAGGLQALVKGGYPVAGKRVVVAGSGPLLLAVAATLRQRGAHVLLVAEQAPWLRLARFTTSLLATPGKLLQALKLRGAILNVPYHAGSYVLRAEGGARLQRVTLQLPTRRIDVECDYLACGYGLIPNLGLARAMDCAIERGAVAVDALQRTSHEHVYCAGEGAGVAGVDCAIVEGRIAGYAATEQIQAATRYQSQRQRWRAFGRRLETAFALDPALRTLADADTIVCRCEDVRHAELIGHASWRSAKLHTRCGMGACQGAVCGAATENMYGWGPDAMRPPLAPVRIGTWLQVAGDCRR